MFFMIAVLPGQKELGYSEPIPCSNCTAYGRFRIFMSFSSLVLFFIPCFRWDRHYYAECPSCGRVYELDHEKGRRFERGEYVDIAWDDLN